MLTDPARLVLRRSVSLVVTLLRLLFTGAGTARHSGHPITTVEPVATIPAVDVYRGLVGRRVPAADASRAPPALHA